MSVKIHMLLEFDSMEDYRDAVFDDLYDSIPSLVGWEILEVYSDEEQTEE